MALRQIRLYGDDILRKKAKPVTAINDHLLTLLDDMLETLRDRNGVGLAAPQVGVLRRVMVVEMDEKLYEMINPVVVESDGTQRRNEACLSVPGKMGDIDRPAHIKIEAQNRHGEYYTVEGNDMLASALCHELDHLDGVLFIDRAFKITDRPDDEDED
jgi:peptide deformylase